MGGGSTPWKGQKIPIAADIKSGKTIKQKNEIRGDDT